MLSTPTGALTSVPFSAGVGEFRIRNSATLLSSVLSGCAAPIAVGLVDSRRKVAWCHCPSAGNQNGVMDE